jgi:hypothetical protein
MPDIHWAGLAPGVALVLAFVITLSSAFAGSIVDRLRVTGRRLHVTTLVATALSAALVVVGASRARRLPELTRCAELLPLVATVHPGIDGPPNESGVRDLEVAAGVHLVSRCDRDGCEGTLESAGNPREAPRDDLRFSPADVVEIRHDARHDLWMASAVRSHPGVDWMCLGRKGPELDDLHLLTVSDADVAGRFGPSRGWLVGAALGVMIALLALARGRREHARLRDLAGAVEARLDDGWLVFDDGAAPVRAPDDIVGRGSVVVRVAGRQGGAAYRVADRREVEVVAPGTLDRLQHALRLEAARHDALALGALALLVAPLVASALLGFLG